MTPEPEKQSEPSDTAKWARHWTKEIDASRKWLEKWHKQGEKVVARYLDDRDESTSTDTRWNYFTANVQTRQAMLYGNTPRATVSRRFSDAADDDARVAGIIMERKLNCDVEQDGDGFSDALALALSDYELPGLGFIRWRYVPSFETVPAKPAVKDEQTGEELEPAVDAYEQKAGERAESIYVYWRDLLYSPSRTYGEWRWAAFRVPYTPEMLKDEFGEKLAASVPLNSKKREKNASDAQQSDPFDRADVWEIWDKERRKVFKFVEGMAGVLSAVDDPLKLDGFFPWGRPMAANTTTSAFVPRPNYCLTQDVYNEIDTVSSRITLLERAIVVRGIYDSSQPALKQLLGGTASNELIPAENFGALMEKGGLKGIIEFLPLEMIVAALTALRDYRKELVDALFQLTGMSDIMRGQSTAPTTATEARAKANFGSVRMQALQSEFARFASDSLKVKAEIIAKHFDPQTIVAESNIMATADAKTPEGVERINRAVALLKSSLSSYRIQVKPEAVSLTDFAAEKQDATEFIGGLATFLQAATPLVQAMPGSLPHVLKLGQWAFAKYRGAQEVESVFDEAIEGAEQAAANPQPQQQNPKLAEIAAKGQAQMAHEDKKLQNAVALAQVDVEVERQKQQAQTEFNVMEHRAKTAMTPPKMPNGGPQR